MRVGDPMRGDILNRANGKCEYCHYPEHFSPSAFEVEHIIPKSANGLTRIENLALACSHCNAYKVTHQTGIDPYTETNVRLFNPRLDNWIDHFVLNRESGEIQGRTPIGRATVETLKMNAEHPLKARQNLIKLLVI